jgi:hypothetical protein
LNDAKREGRSELAGGATAIETAAAREFDVAAAERENRTSILPTDVARPWDVDDATEALERSESFASRLEAGEETGESDVASAPPVLERIDERGLSREIVDAAPRGAPEIAKVAQGQALAEAPEEKERMRSAPATERATTPAGEAAPVIEIQLAGGGQGADPRRIGRDSGGTARAFSGSRSASRRGASREDIERALTGLTAGRAELERSEEDPTLWQIRCTMSAGQLGRFVQRLANLGVVTRPTPKAEEEDPARRTPPAAQTWYYFSQGSLAEGADEEREAEASELNVTIRVKDLR